MSITPETAKALLDSADFGDRIRGINQLRELPAIEAFGLLAPILQDENVRVRYAAVSLLASVGQVDRVKSLAWLRVGLSDPELDVQAAAADAIAGLKLTEGFDDLKRLYESSNDWIVRMSIVASLGELADPRGFDLLQSALASGDDVLLPAAIGALGELGDPRAVELLQPYAVSEDWQVRYRVLQSMMHFDTPAAKAAIAQFAQDSEPRIVEQAKLALE
jgi:HEAT repeat protein